MRNLSRRGVGDYDYGTILDAESAYGQDQVLQAYQDQAGIFGDIANLAARGFNGMGDASQALLRTGYAIEEIRNAFHNIAAVAGAPTAEVELAANELRYLNNTGARRDSSAGIWLAIGAGVLLYLATRNRD